ncbi:MAG: type II toxin-antitoxin system VapB family antitoxin [Anaerolineales bacterium]|nr:type II toxin-antitoxin system VapB family antitoxin [Anaerolineales bacterium]
MRTNVVIDDELMAEAMNSTGLTTKKAVIEEALRTLIRLKAQQDIRLLRGQLNWEGNLDEMREGRLINVDS